MGPGGKLRRFAVAVALGLGIAALAPSPAPAHSQSTSCQAFGSNVFQRCAVRFSWIKGFNDPATPDNLDRVGVLKVGSPFARNVLVLNPGTSAGSGYFRPLADDIVRDTHGAWQVWSVERRENQLEDQSVLDAASRAGRLRSSCSTTTSGGSADSGDHQPLPADPRLVGRVRARLGDERRDPGPAPGRRGARAARRPGRARGPLARRLDHHRLRDVGLQRQGRAPRISPASSTSTAAATRCRSAQQAPPSRCRACSPARRGFRSAASPPRSAGLFSATGSLGRV